MYPIPWYAIILIAIPQTFLIISIGARLFNIGIKVQNRIFVSTIIGLICYFTRYLTIPGLNTIALLISTILILSIASRLTLWKSALVVVLGLAVLAITETLCNSIVFSLFNLTFDILAVRPWLNILSYLPTLTVAALFYWLILWKDMIMYNLGQNEDHAQ